MKKRETSSVIKLTLAVCYSSTRLLNLSEYMWMLRRPNNQLDSSTKQGGVSSSHLARFNMWQLKDPNRNTAKRNCPIVIIIGPSAGVTMFPFSHLLQHSMSTPVIGSPWISAELYTDRHLEELLFSSKSKNAFALNFLTKHFITIELPTDFMRFRRVDRQIWTLYHWENFGRNGIFMFPLTSMEHILVGRLLLHSTQLNTKMAFSFWGRIL